MHYPTTFFQPRRHCTKLVVGNPHQPGQTLSFKLPGIPQGWDTHSLQEWVKTHALETTPVRVVLPTQQGVAGSITYHLNKGDLLAILSCL